MLLDHSKGFCSGVLRRCNFLGYHTSYEACIMCTLKIDYHCGFCCSQLIVRLIVEQFSETQTGIHKPLKNESSFNPKLRIRAEASRGACLVVSFVISKRAIACDLLIDGTSIQPAPLRHQFPTLAVPIRCDNLRNCHCRLLVRFIVNRDVLLAQRSETVLPLLKYMPYWKDQETASFVHADQYIA